MRVLRTYMIDGFEIELIDHRSRAFQLVATMMNGREVVIGESEDPVEAYSYESRVARNPAVVKRIELRDRESSIDAIWDASWP